MTSKHIGAVLTLLALLCSQCDIDPFYPARPILDAGAADSDASDANEQGETP